MAYRTATFDGQAHYISRDVATFSVGRVLRAIGCHVALGFGAVLTVGAVGGIVTLAAIWFVGSAGMTNPYVPTKITGPGTLSLAGNAQASTGSFETTWIRSQGSRLAAGRPVVIDVPESAPQPVLAAKAAPVAVARLDPPAAIVARPIPVPAIPLPQTRPAMPQQELTRAPSQQPTPHVAPEGRPAPQVAALTAPSGVEKRPAPQAVPSPMGALPDSVSRTAVYDITNSTVYLPNGQKLEAHSGLYDKMDDPRHIKVRMRGPTPPNVYVLTERESLFHGVRAIRLNPVDRDKMYGRDGILAHTYMLGPNGQSNGCVSFKDYDKFLEAFLAGKVDKMVVVADLGNMSWRTAALQADGVSVPARRLASTSSRPRRYPAFFGEEERYSPALSFVAPQREGGSW